MPIPLFPRPGSGFRTCRACPASWALALTLTLMLGPGSALATVHIEAPAEVVAVLAPHLEEAGSDADPERSQRRLRALAMQILTTEGYFSPEFEITAEAGALTLKVEPGPRTMVREVTIDIDGTLDERERSALIAGWRLPVGRAFRQEDWTLAKQELLERLLAADRPGARLVDSVAEIDVDGRQVRLKLSYDAGARYRFGALAIDGLQRYPPTLIDQYNDSVHPGEPYTEEKLARLQRNLQATPYFSSVRVDIDRDIPPGADGIVIAPVRLRVREAAPHRLGLGIGVSSNTGARAELNYRSADILHKAWELSGGVRLEQKKQSAYADIFLPPNRLRYRDSFGALAENEDINGLRTERWLLGGQRRHQRGEVEMRLSVDWQTETQKPEGAAADTINALTANGLWIWRHVDSSLDPRRGLVVQGQLGGGARALLSDQNFLRLHGRIQAYLPLGHRDTLMLRGEWGHTLAPSRRGIPQDFLFRAGGTGSVRGYDYRSLGVRQGEAIVGGRMLATASAEAVHWLDSYWGVAGFVDAGDAGDRLDQVRPAVGYGAGVRWRSPAGPVAVDLAYGERDRRLRLHFFLAIPF